MPLLSDETVIQKANYRVNTAGTKLIATNGCPCKVLRRTRTTRKLIRRLILDEHPATEASRPQAWS